MGPAAGVGLYVLDPQGGPQMIEAPHTRADEDSEQVAVAVFRRARARALLLAGAHRYAVPKPRRARWAPADVAHQRRSAFHAVHLALRSRGLRTVLQPHGYPGPVEAIVSSGTSRAEPAARQIHRRLRAARPQIESCLYRSRRCERYGGTRNIQGQDVRAARGQFVHLELVRALRTHATARGRLAEAIGAGPWR